MMTMIKAITYLLFFLLIINTGCVSAQDARIPHHRNITIATFNIQNLGLTKMHRQEDVDRIVSIIRSYDIIAIQEISDHQQRVANLLLDAINHTDIHNPYSVSVSPRTGIQPDDAPKVEQYAFYYRQSSLELLRDYLYDDSQHDYFGREPWIARFHVIDTDYTVTLITIHTVPNVTISEINALHYVAQSAEHEFVDEENFIILGDMNADCEYTREQTLHDTLLYTNPEYFWIVPDTADTNQAASSCAFDRIVISQELRRHYSNTWGINNRIPRTVSDHYPVWFQLTF